MENGERRMGQTPFSIFHFPFPQLLYDSCRTSIAPCFRSMSATVFARSGVVATQTPKCPPLKRGSKPTVIVNRGTRDSANRANTVDSEPISTRTSKPKIVSGAHDAMGLPPPARGQYFDVQIAIQ